jgi:putative DNA primase/helicase
MKMEYGHKILVVKSNEVLYDLANLLILCLKIKMNINENLYEYSRKWQSQIQSKYTKNAQVYHPISISEFDNDPYIFNCKNGTLDVRKRTCQEQIVQINN